MVNTMSDRGFLKVAIHRYGKRGLPVCCVRARIIDCEIISIAAYAQTLAEAERWAWISRNKCMLYLLTEDEKRWRSIELNVELSVASP